MSIRITRVYTRSGDKRETGLVGGMRAPKDSQKIEAYGTIDELNAIIGITRSLNENTSALSKDYNPSRLECVLKCLQNELFNLGSDIATPPNKTNRSEYIIKEEHVKKIEETIDDFNKGLSTLNSFVLPGGSIIGAFLHQARTICRRAERVVIGLSRIEKVEETHTKYLNRLSDLLFVLSRWVNKELGRSECLWRKGLI